MESPSAQNSFNRLQPDWRFVSEALRRDIGSSVDELLRNGDLQQRLTALLCDSPEQHELDVQKMLDLRLSSAESVAAVTILESIIKERWKNGNRFMHADTSVLDVRPFETEATQAYEWMDTKVHPDSLHGGIGKLLLHFPAGSQEAETSHTHPGARIVVSRGPGKFTCPPLSGDPIHLDAGTVILMPKDMPHNFSAYPEQDWNPISIHLPYAGIGKEAMTIL